MKSGSESDGDTVMEGGSLGRSRRRITFPAQVSFQCAVQQQDNGELVRLLAQHGTRLDLNACNHSGMSLLQQATANRNLDTVKVLLCAGADVSLQDLNGNTALHSAASAGFRQAASLLIIYGADLFHISHEGDMPVDVAKDNATIDMLTVEMRRQLQNQIFLDQYGFIFRGIELWERFLDWSKEFLTQSATVIWQALSTQYTQFMKQRSEMNTADHTREGTRESNPPGADHAITDVPTSLCPTNPDNSTERTEDVGGGSDSIDPSQRGGKIQEDSAPANPVCNPESDSTIGVCS